MDVESAAAYSDEIRIALCLDSGYAPWAATTMASCLRVNPGRGVAFDVVHDCSLSERDIDGFQKIADEGGSSVEFHAIDPSSGLDGLPTNAEFGNVVWLRLYLPEILTDVSRILYLDSDTFVAGHLRELWETPLGDAPLAAVANVVEPPMRAHVAGFGINYPGGYFNSGVLLMNLERMRAEASLEQLLRFAVDHRRELVWPDQDVLNAVFSDRWLSLHARFNAQSVLWHPQGWALEVFREDEVSDAKRAPVVRHFEGRGLCKPWHYMCPVPGYKEYRNMLATTPWAHMSIEDRTPATRLIRLLPSQLQLPAYRRLEGWRARTTAN